MGVNSTRVRAMFDADPSVQLRTAGQVDNTTVGATLLAGLATPAVNLRELNTAYWHVGNPPAVGDVLDIPYAYLDINVVVTKALIGAPSTYRLDVIVDDTLLMTDTPTLISSLVIVPVTGVGAYKMVIDAKSIPKFDPEHAAVSAGKFLTLSLLTSGAGATFNFYAWIGGSVKATA